MESIGASTRPVSRRRQRTVRVVAQRLSNTHERTGARQYRFLDEKATHQSCARVFGNRPGAHRNGMVTASSTSGIEDMLINTAWQGNGSVPTVAGEKCCGQNTKKTSPWRGSTGVVSHTFWRFVPP